MRRTIVMVVSTVLVVIGSAALAAPAASATPSPEYRIRWSHDQVAGIRGGIARGDALCDISSLAAGTVVGIATGGASVGVSAAIGTAVGGVGLFCGNNDPKLRDAVDEAYWRNCRLDAYVTDGPLSYDTRYRYKVCP